jgi:hypothetical protein
MPRNISEEQMPCARFSVNAVIVILPLRSEQLEFALVGYLSLHVDVSACIVKKNYSKSSTKIFYAKRSAGQK